LALVNYDNIVQMCFYHYQNVFFSHVLCIQNIKYNTTNRRISSP